MVGTAQILLGLAVIVTLFEISWATESGGVPASLAKSDQVGGGVFLPAILKLSKFATGVAPTGSPTAASPSPSPTPTSELTNSPTPSEQLITATPGGNSTVQPEPSMHKADYSGCIVTKATDKRSDGSINERSTSVYTSFGAVLRQDYDENNDGTTDTIVTWGYNEYGRVVSRRDTVKDGETIRFARFDYDADGRFTGILTDTDGNGDSDLESIFEYDGNSNLIKETSQNPVESEIYSIVHKEYAPDGLLSLVRLDIEGDGTGDAVTAFKWEDELIQSRSTTDSAGNVTLLINHIYEGRLLKKLTFDTDGNGKVGMSVNYKYNESGWLTEIKRERGKEVDLIVTTEYDVEGRIVSEKNTYTGVTDLSKYMYDCPLP